MSRCLPLDGYFDNLARIALKCPAGCFTCTSTTLCTSCSANYFLRPDNLCYSTCLPRYYANPSTWTCVKCPFDCYQCNGNGKCLSCSPVVDYRILTARTSRCLSLVGHFDKKVQICPLCPQNCSICVSETRCLSCLAGYFLNSSKLCSNVCPLRFYQSTQTFSCQPCPYDCLSCNFKG